MNMYADGYLEDTETHYKYYIPISDFELLDEGNLTLLLDSNEPYEHKLEKYAFESGNVVFYYQVHADKTEKLLESFKKSTKNEEIKNKVATDIIKIVQKEYKKGFFVLPIPPNFLVDKENNVSFIYKATQGMPITNFGFNQIFTHLKRLITFIYADSSFNELLEMKQVQTTNEKLIAISKCSDFEELLKQFKSQKELEQEILQQELLDEILDLESEEDDDRLAFLDEIKSSKIKKEPVPIKETETITPLVTTKKNEIPIQKEIQTKNVVAKHTPGNSLKSKSTIIFIGLIVSLIFSVAVATYLTVDKLTYPSQVTRLKEDIKQYKEQLDENEKDIEQKEEALKKAKEKNDKSEKTIKDNETELEETIKALKDALDQNKKLRERIDKGGAL